MKRKYLVALLVLFLIMPTLVLAYIDEGDEVSNEEQKDSYDELAKIIGTNEENAYGYWYVNESLNTSGQDRGVLSKGFEIRDICDNLFSQSGQGEGGFVLVPNETEDKFDSLIQCGESVRAGVADSPTHVYYGFFHRFIMDRTTGNWFMYDLDNTRLPEILGVKFRYAHRLPFELFENPNLKPSNYNNGDLFASAGLWGYQWPNIDKPNHPNKYERVQYLDQWYSPLMYTETGANGWPEIKSKEHYDNRVQTIFGKVFGQETVNAMKTNFGPINFERPDVNLVASNLQIVGEPEQINVGDKIELAVHISQENKTRA